MTLPIRFQGKEKELNGRTKLTAAEVVEIKDLLAQGVRQQWIADKFGVTLSNISAIHRGKSWSNREYIRNCRWCKKDFATTTGNSRYCSPEHWKLGHDKVYRNWKQEIWLADPINKAKYDADRKAWADANREHIRAHGLEYSRTPAGRASNTKYRTSIKGAITRARIHAERRTGQRGNYHLFLVMVKIFKFPCAQCGASFVPGLMGHHIDHIFAVGVKLRPPWLVDINQWSNLQILCNKCHKAKTRIDKIIIIAINKNKFLLSTD